MSNQEEISRLIEDLGSFKKRAQSRKQLAAHGTEAAEPLMRVIADPERSENMRWAAITLIEACAYRDACPVLLDVARSPGGLQGTAISALETITGLSIGDDPEEWEKALADVEGYRDKLECGAEEEDESAESEEKLYGIFRKALADIASEFTWEEDERYLYLRIPLAGGRKQQMIVTFADVSPGGQPLVSIYTECGEATPDVVAMVSRRNVTVKYGKFAVEEEQDGEGNGAKVVMRIAVPSQRLTPDLAREIVLTMAAEADALELELTGADHI